MCVLPHWLACITLVYATTYWSRSILTWSSFLFSLPDFYPMRRIWFFCRSWRIGRHNSGVVNLVVVVIIQDGALEDLAAWVYLRVILEVCFFSCRIVCIHIDHNIVMYFLEGDRAKDIALELFGLFYLFLAFLFFNFYFFLDVHIEWRHSFDPFGVLQLYFSGTEYVLVFFLEVGSVYGRHREASGLHELNIWDLTVSQLYLISLFIIFEGIYLQNWFLYWTRSLRVLIGDRIFLRGTHGDLVFLRAALEPTHFQWILSRTYIWRSDACHWVSRRSNNAIRMRYVGRISTGKALELTSSTECST